MQAVRRLFASIVAVLTITIGVQQVHSKERDTPLVIFAAASLSGAMNEAVATWSTATGNLRPKVSIAASAILARQIEAGAPADIFISANKIWANYLAGKKLTFVQATNIANNRLVFAARNAEPSQDGDLRHILLPHISTRFAMADPDTAPAGQYARETLQSIGLWDLAQLHVVYGGNARQTFALVDRAGIPGFLYGSDVALSDTIASIVTLPQTSHTPIEYRATVVKNSAQHLLAEAFIVWLTGPDGQKTLVSHGFQPR